MHVWHIVTSGYPPQEGGVSDYTSVLTHELSTAGDKVHVWCPKDNVGRQEVVGVTVHATFGSFGPASLLRVGKQLSNFGDLGSHRLLLQWVPHAYGYRAMNLFICLWLWGRAKIHRDRVEIMVHEPYLAFGQKRLKQKTQALVQRLMTIILVNAASHIWVSIPAWETCWRKYTLGRRVPFTWLPVPSNVPISSNENFTESVRRHYVSHDGVLVGHFGTYYPQITEVLESVIPQLLINNSKATMLLLGRGSEEFRNHLCLNNPQLTKQIHATGELKPQDISGHLKACDVMLQPYHEGITTRRSSIMASLAHGLPIVTTVGHLTESLWDESGAVVLCRVGDDLSLVEATQQLLNDATERERLGSAAESVYRARFDVKHTVAALRGSAEFTDRALMSVQYPHRTSDGGA
jgi:glycosyltransferase involved in cell wall biosynthesis